MQIIKKLNIVMMLVFLMITISLGIAYLTTNDLKYLLFTLLTFFVTVILHCFKDIKYYIIHLIFYIAIFIFLVSRPTIDYFKLHTFNTYQKDAYVFAFVIVMISLFGLVLGGIIGKHIFTSSPKNKVKTADNDYFSKIRFVAMGMFLCSYPFYLLRLIERLLYRLSTDYYTYYATFQSKLPYFTYILSMFTLYAMCVYLAAKPKKLPATLVLISFTFANAIYLFIGTRNPFMLSILFAFLYYVIRNQEKQQIWIGIKEKIAMVFSVPALAVFMGMLNYIRDSISVKQTNIFDLLLDFIYKQGTSFGVLARGYLYNTNLPIREFTNFTFGPIIEYFSRGSIGIYLLGNKPFLTSTNSLELALESNSYSHNLSYIVLKNDYLAGHGLGGSYIMDIYTDYGYIGVLILSILLGLLFIWMLETSYKNQVLRFAISLLISYNLFFMPRSSFSESFFPLFTMQFWIAISAIYVTLQFLPKRKQKKERIL